MLNNYVFVKKKEYFHGNFFKQERRFLRKKQKNILTMVSIDILKCNTLSVIF